MATRIASPIRAIPESKSPEIKSLIPAVNATPGTRASAAPTMILSRLSTNLISKDIMEMTPTNMLAIKLPVKTVRERTIILSLIKTAIYEAKNAATKSPNFPPTKTAKIPHPIPVANNRNRYGYPLYSSILRRQSIASDISILPSTNLREKSLTKVILAILLPLFLISFV